MMKVRALVHCDAILPTGKRPLFQGQGYDLPDDEAARLIAAGLVESLAPAAKMVAGPPEDKALKPKRTVK